MSIPQLPDVTAEAPKRKGPPQIPIPKAWQEGQAHAPQVGAQERILFWCTLVAIVVSFLFWSSWWTRIWRDGTFISWVLAYGMSLLCALAMPLMLSSLIPSTPLGYLLLKNRLRGPGYGFLILCLGGFLIFAYTVAMGLAQTNLALAEGSTPEQQLQLARMTALAMLVLFVGIPAWAWVQSSPEKMVLQAWQDHQVRKMEVTFQIELEQLEAQRDQLRKHHKQQLAVIQAQYINALRRLRLPLEQQTAEMFSEVAGILTSLHRHERDVLSRLAVTVDDLVGSNALIPQIEMLNGPGPNYEELKLAITTAANARLALPQPQPAARSPQPQPAEERPPAQPSMGGSSAVDLSYQPPPQPSVADRNGPQRAVELSAGDLRAMEAMRAAYPTDLWMRKHVQTVCKVEKSEANELIKAWIAAGYVEVLKGWTYCWTGGAQ